MSHLTPGLIGAYNSLTDKHLTAYFNNTRIRRHLQRVGLISRSGRIVTEKEFRYKIIHRDQQRHVRESLAQAIFHRVLDMERLHQTEIRRKLEEYARRERVNKVKVERSNRYNEDDPLIFPSPRPPTRLRSSHTQHSGPEREPSDSTDSLGSSRPNTAPEKSHRPVRLKPLNNNTSPTSTKRNSSHYQNHEVTDEREPVSFMFDRDVMRHLTLTDFSSSVSPYRLPVINNFVTPVPPLKRKDKGQNGTLRGRRLRPTTAPSDTPDTKEGAVQRVWSRSAVWVKMVYFGKSVHLTHDLMEMKDEVKIFQQHCGGENLCVYKGRLKEGESFQFMSRRHRGFPFSLTFYLNGLQVERLSSCCEFKHRKSSRLGGRHAHFGFSGVEGAAPCYKCIIAMGLDKKPAPPKRIKNDPLVSKVWENEDEEEKSESSQSRDIDTKRNADQEHKHKKGYEEDFEADDEGPMDDAVDEGNVTSPSLSREAEDERREDENGSDDLNRNKMEESSTSSGLSSSSSSSEEDEEEFDEEQKEEEVKPKTYMPTSTTEKDAEETEVLQTSIASLLTEAENHNQETEHTERDDGEAEEPRVECEKAEEHRNTPEEGEEPKEEPIKPGESEEPGEEAGESKELAEPGEPSEEPGESEEPREESAEVDEPRDDLREDTAEDVNKEGDRVKSVQEKLAEAILNMTECVSEPELSDTTTEEDELVSVVGQQVGPEAEPENNEAQETADEENGAEPVQEAERDETHTEEPEEEPKTDSNETLQPETKMEEEEKDTNQTEIKSPNTTNEDEHVEDEQKNDDDKNEDHKSDIKQDIIDEEEGQNQDDNEFINQENKSNEEPEEMEKAEDEELPPSQEVPLSEELIGQEPEKETTIENSTNEEETRVTPVEEEDNMMEKITENPEETSMTHEDIDHNTEIEKVNDGELSGKEVPAEEVRAEEEETFDDESSNLMNKAEETGKDLTECVEEGDTQDTVLEPKGSSGNEVKDEEGVAGDDDKSEERVEVSEPEEAKEQREDGDVVKTDVGNGTEETEDQDPQVNEDGDTKEETMDEEKINQEIIEDQAEQEEPTPTVQTSEEKAENHIGEEEEEKQEEVAGENDSEAKDEQKFGSEIKDTEEDENEVEDMNDGGEESTDVGEVDAVGQNIEMGQEEGNKEEQEDNPCPAEVLQETTDEPQVKSGETKEENMDEEKFSQEMTEDKAEQEKPTPNGQTSEEKAEDDIGEEEEEREEVAAEKDSEVKDEQKSESEIKETEEDENVVEDMNEVGEESTDVGEVDAEGKNIVMEQKEGNKEEQEDNPCPTEALQETTDGPQVKSGETGAEIGEDIITIAQEELGKKEEPGSGEGEETLETNEEEINQGMTLEEGVKAEQMNKDNEKEEENKQDLQEETTKEKEKEEEQEADMEDIEQDVQETTNEEEVKDEQKDGVENVKPVISDYSIDAITEDEAPLDTKTPVEDLLVDRSKPEDTKVDHESRAEDQNRAEDDIQSSTDLKKDKLAEAAEESRSIEGSTSPPEESQPLENVLEREAELIIAPQTDHEELVSNWVNIHQASNYFETFVEPLEEIKIPEGEMPVNAEAVEMDETVLSPEGSHKNEELSTKDEQNSLPVDDKCEELKETIVENFNMETEALGAEGQGNPVEEEEVQGQMASEQALEFQEDVAVDNIVNISATPLMKIEISQDS